MIRSVAGTPPRRTADPKPTARRSTKSAPIVLELASPDRERQFIAAVRRSRRLHRPWVYPPDNIPAFRRYIQNLESDSNVGYFALYKDTRLAGVINLNNIVMGGFCSASLGYYAFEPWSGVGVMSKALALVVKEAFTAHGLHRLEANIQPKNARSKQLVQRHHFRYEGLAQRLLKVGDRYRDHERWALTVEEWRARRESLQSG